MCRHGDSQCERVPVAGSSVEAPNEQVLMPPREGSHAAGQGSSASASLLLRLAGVKIKRARLRYHWSTRGGGERVGQKVTHARCWGALMFARACIRVVAAWSSRAEQSRARRAWVFARESRRPAFHSRPNGASRLPVEHRVHRRLRRCEARATSGPPPRGKQDERAQSNPHHDHPARPRPRPSSSTRRADIRLSSLH